MSSTSTSTTGDGAALCPAIRSTLHRVGILSLPIRQYHKWVNGIAIFGIMLAVFVLIGAMPVDRAFDHSAFDALLAKHVDKDGWVDYEGLHKDAALLDSYIASLGNAPFAELGRDQKLALLINAYNAFTLRLILDHYPIKSIKDIPSAKRWDAKRWRISTMTLSLNQIEHEQIRPKFAEPRIHFALVCAAIGCPKLRNEAYQAERIEEQLEDQTRYLHSHDRWFGYQPGAKEVHLTKLYKWYGADFEQVAGSVLDFAARYSSALKIAIEKDKTPRIKWLDYDWTLNDRNNNR